MPASSLVPLLLGLLLLGHAQAAVGDPPALLLEEIAHHQPQRQEQGYRAAQDFRFELSERGGLLHSVSGEGLMDVQNIDFMADLVAAATGYGEPISAPVAGFLSTRLAELSGRGEAAIRVEEYRLTLEVSGDSAPYRVRFTLALEEVPAELFPQSGHVRGPADARFVVREFSDFQCPFCARFAATVLPRIEEQLLARGDVRFEYHHFPLKSIHPNAGPAAEAAECVTEANGPQAFWTYHDGLFARQAQWQALDDPLAYFVDLAADLGLDTSGVEQCLRQGQYRVQVDDAYEHAGAVLGLSGTPSVFINGYKVQDFQNPQALSELIELLEAFSSDE